MILLFFFFTSISFDDLCFHGSFLKNDNLHYTELITIFWGREMEIMRYFIAAAPT